jgi:hypothetical protein
MMILLRVSHLILSRDHTQPDAFSFAQWGF